MNVRMVLGLVCLGFFGLAGCEEGDKAATSPSSGSTEPPVPTAVAKSTAAAPVEAEPQGEPAGEILTAHPELLVDGAGIWRLIELHLSGGKISEANCPELREIKETEPFARREAEAKAKTACKPRLEQERKKAADVLEGLKTCPFVERFNVWVHDYQFDRKVFPLWTVQNQQSNRGLFARSGKSDEAVIGRWRLAWPGAQPFGESWCFTEKPTGWHLTGYEYLPASIKSTGDKPCTGPLLNVVPVLSSLYLELRLPATEAKKLSEATHERSSGRQYVEVAIILTGKGPGEATLACGQVVRDKVPGKALAWRVTASGDESSPPTYITPWVTAHDWNPPKNCDKVRRLLGAGDDAGAPTNKKSGGGADKDPGAPQGGSSHEASAGDCSPCSTQEDFDAVQKRGRKCCPVIACKSDADCTGGRVCCRIPDGQLCGDAHRCPASERVR